MSIENPSATEYIQHHMQHLQSLHQQVIVDFSVFNYDTLFFSILSLLVVFFVLLALTVFCWVTIMNCIDLIPVDFFPWLAGLVGINHLRPLPTADLNGTLGLSFGVLCLLFYYGIKVKGFSGFIIELFTAPFGKFPLLWPVNLLMNIIEYLAKFVSLGMRLFGNMYAGELVFFLIALLGGYMLEFGLFGGAAAGIGQVIAGLVWWLFHVLIVLLQAFIFMMLTLVYIGQAHSSH